MIGFFIVDELQEKDAQGAPFVARVHSEMNDEIRGALYLPPFMRPNQCNIVGGSKVYGVLDDVTGRGFAIFGTDDADFGYFLDANIQIKQNLSISGDAAIGGNSSVNGDSNISGNLTATGNITGADCRITLAKMSLPNPAWVDDGKQTDPDAAGHPRFISKPAAVSSLASHTHTCAAPGAPTTPPIPTPLPG